MAELADLFKILMHNHASEQVVFLFNAKINKNSLSLTVVKNHSEISALSSHKIQQNIAGQFCCVLLREIAITLFITGMSDSLSFEKVTKQLE